MRVHYNTEERKLNKPLIERIIKRLEDYPESYDQEDFGRKWRTDFDKMYHNRPKPPCGTVCCLAGEAIICASVNPKAGAIRLMKLINGTNISEPELSAARALGIAEHQAGLLFEGGAVGWPKKYRKQYNNAKSFRGQARAAINLLKAILKTNGEILEWTNLTFQQ
jgi:hypothetical protein